MSRILLVEDDGDYARLLLLAFERAGFRPAVEVVQDGREALGRLLGGEKRDYLPDLVILDMNLPGMHGLEVLENMRADPRLKALPVYVLTNCSDPQVRREAERLGVAAFDEKPAGLPAFTQAVARIREALPHSVGP